MVLFLEIPGALDQLRRPDPGFVLRQNQILVVDPGGAAQLARLREGDRVASVGGTPIRARADLAAALVGYGVGDEVTLEITRSGGRFRLPLVLGSRPLRDRILDLLMGASLVCFLFLGFVTYLRRDDALGRTFYLACVLFAVTLLDLPRLASPNLMRLLEGLRDASQLFLPAALLRFLLNFPEGIEGKERRYRRQRWILMPPVALAPLHVWSTFAPPSPVTRRVIDGLLLVTVLLFAVYVVAGLVVFVRKIRRRDRWVLWSKLRLALIGLVAGLLPLVGTAVLRQFLPTEPLLLDELAVLALPLVPASFSVALLRTGAIDIAYLTRQVLVAALVAVPVILVFALVTGLLGARLDAATRTLVFVGLLILIPIVSLVLRSPVRPLAGLVDRIVYPGQRAIRAAAQELGERLSDCREPDALARILCEGLREMVGARSVYLYRRGEHELALAATSLRDATANAVPETLAADAELARRALQSHELLLIEPLVHGPRPARLDDESRFWLDATGAIVLCALVPGDRELALVALGGRADGGSYAAAHFFHVQALCRMAAVAWENALLHEEDLARERDRTEIELAREIQRNLLPAEDVHLARAEICGTMVSCRRVGGDLYDHFALSNGHLVFAVADAAGKGVPASLLVSSMRTSLRETIRPGLPLDEAIVHINRHVHGMTGVGHFIALFVGILDPASRLLEYCVAGIEPPVWVRRSQRRAELLTRGGAVLGIDPTARYRGGTVRLGPGDLVLAYSDGLVDEENLQGEEFGRGRLLQIATKTTATSARGALDSILDALGNHRAEADPVDDTTLLMLRIPEEEAAGTELA